MASMPTAQTTGGTATASRPPRTQSPPDAKTQLGPFLGGPGAQPQSLPDAKHTRINRWRSEIDPRDVVCACSEHLDLDLARGSGGGSGSSSSKAAAEQPCRGCGRPGESWEQRWRGSGDHPSSSLADQARRMRKISLIRRFFNNKKQNRGSSASPLPREGGGGGATQMYRQDEADDEASSASEVGKLSDSVNGNAKPKLGVDDTAARLRRAQKLLNAQTRGNG